MPRPNASQLRVDYITATLASDALGLGTRLRGHHRFQLRCMQSVKIFQKSLVYSMEFAREFLPISRLIKAKLYLTSSVTVYDGACTLFCSAGRLWYANNLRVTGRSET